MVKHSQTIRRQKPTNCLNVFDHFVGLALKWLISESTGYVAGANKILLRAVILPQWNITQAINPPTHKIRRNTVLCRNMDASSNKMKNSAFLVPLLLNTFNAWI